MTRIIKDLLLAMLNATLILIALCLFLGWKMADRANDVAETFAKSLIRVEPVKAEIAGTREEIAGLRADLAAIRGDGTLGDAALDRVEAQVDGISARLDGMQTRMQDLHDLPYDLTDHAIQSAADAFGNTLSSVIDRRQSTE